MMKTLILIPARMASKRFPNKPMAIIEGKPMIQRVWEQAIASDIGNVIVACSEQEVLNCIISLGGDAILTDPDLPSGTDRIFEAIKNNNVRHLDSIINLQGDMPIINPKDIVKVNTPLLQGFDMGTLVTELKEDQKNIVYSALKGFHQFTKPGQVNILDVDWPNNTVNDVLIVGNSKDAIRPKRVSKRVYQTDDDMSLAITHYGEDAKGIVSPEAVRQYKYYNHHQAKL